MSNYGRDNDNYEGRGNNQGRDNYEGRDNNQGRDNYQGRDNNQGRQSGTYIDDPPHLCFCSFATPP